MKKKGFTLIELLAVIVILAIIALIAVPIILNIIGSSKKSSVVRSGELYLKAVETAIARKNLTGQFNPTTCTIGNDGNLTCDGETITIEAKGSKPTSGTITLEKGKIILVENMTLDGQWLVKEENERLRLNELPPLDPKGTYLMVNPYVSSVDTYFLGQENIKRNQVESITITYTNKVPSNVLGSWDVSAAKDGSIMAWYYDEDNNDLYDIYIGGEGGVKANPNSSYLFSCFNKVTTIDVTYLDTSEVTNMIGMFSDSKNLAVFDSSLTNLIGLNNFDTSKVSNMSSMFRGCGKLTELDVSNFDTSNVTSMSSMFQSCHSLTNLDISNFNTSQVKSMLYMFYYCEELTELDVSNFDTSNVINMAEMFSICKKLKKIDVSKFNTNQVTTMASMFNECSSLINLDISNFNTSQVTNMNFMFSHCSSLINLDVSKFNTSQVTTMLCMFQGCKNLTHLNVSNFDTSKVTNMASMFASCSKLNEIDVSNFDTSKVTNMNSTFYAISNLISIDLRNAVFTSVTSYTNMLNDTTKITTIIVKDNDAKTFIEARLVEAGKSGVTVTIA